VLARLLPHATHAGIRWSMTLTNRLHILSRSQCTSTVYNIIFSRCNSTFVWKTNAPSKQMVHTAYNNLEISTNKQACPTNSSSCTLQQSGVRPSSSPMHDDVTIPVYPAMQTPFSGVHSLVWGDWRRRKSGNFSVGFSPTSPWCQCIRRPRHGEV